MTLVDVVSGETLGSFPAPAGEFEEVQTFAFGSGARVGAVAWGEGDGDGRLDLYTRLTAYPRDGGELTLPLPAVGPCVRHVRVSSYHGDLATTTMSSCNEMFAFNPGTGERMADPNLPQSTGGDAFHTLPDGTSAGSDTVTVSLWQGEQTRRIANPCTGDQLEAAPDPSNPDAVFIRCDNQLVRCDFELDTTTPIVGGTAAELNLRAFSLGVAVGFD